MAHFLILTVNMTHVSLAFYPFGIQKVSQRTIDDSNTVSANVIPELPVLLAYLFFTSLGMTLELFKFQSVVTIFFFSLEPLFRNLFYFLTASTMLKF